MLCVSDHRFALALAEGLPPLRWSTRCGVKTIGGGDDVFKTLLSGDVLTFLSNVRQEVYRLNMALSLTVRGHIPRPLLEEKTETGAREHVPRPLFVKIVGLVLAGDWPKERRAPSPGTGRYPARTLQPRPDPRVLRPLVLLGVSGRWRGTQFVISRYFHVVILFFSVVLRSARQAALLPVGGHFVKEPCRLSELMVFLVESITTYQALDNHLVMLAVSTNGKFTHTPGRQGIAFVDGHIFLPSSYSYARSTSRRVSSALVKAIARIQVLEALASRRSCSNGTLFLSITTRDPEVDCRGVSNSSLSRSSRA